MSAIGEIEAALVANGNNRLEVETTIDTSQLNGYEVPFVQDPEVEVSFNFVGDVTNYTEQEGRSALTTNVPIQSQPIPIKAELGLVDNLPRQLDGSVNVVAQLPTEFGGEFDQKSKELEIIRDDDIGGGKENPLNLSNRDIALGIGAAIALAGVVGGG